MKWKLYNACSLYNAIVMAIYLSIAGYAAFLYPDDGGLIVLFFAFGLIITKNLMGYRLYRRMKHNEIHQDGFGALFFILWIFNIIVFVFITSMVLEEMTQESISAMFRREIGEMLMLLSSYLFVFTGFYTLILDILIEKKVKKQYDASAGLLQGDN